MAKETMAEMATRHAGELDALRQELEQRYSTVVAGLQRERDDLNRQLGEAQGAVAPTQDALKAAKADTSRSQQLEQQARRERNEMQTERDVLRGFIMREIPVKLAELPAPISGALGVYTSGL